MKTRKLISNISYNTDNFFEDKINSLIRRKKILYAYWIRHQPDTDNTKSHLHFVIRPNDSIETSQLDSIFKEFDPKKPDKPLGVLPGWRNSKMDDWLLYGVHDAEYLASKGLSRNIHYQYSDIKTTSAEMLESDWFMIDRSKYKRMKAVHDAVVEGKPFYILCREGTIPIAQRAQYEHQYYDELSAYCRSLQVDKDGVVIEE